MARLISCDTVNGILFEVLEPRGKVRHCHVHCHADTTVPVTSYPLILAPLTHCMPRSQPARCATVRSCAVPTPPATSRPMHRSHTAAHTLHASQPTGEIVTPSQLAACCGLSTWGCWACIKIGDLSLSAWITRVTGLSAGNGVCDDGVDRLKLLSCGVQELLQAAASKERSEEQQLQSVRAPAAPPHLHPASSLAHPRRIQSSSSCNRRACSRGRSVLFPQTMLGAPRPHTPTTRPSRTRHPRHAMHAGACWHGRKNVSGRRRCGPGEGPGGGMRVHGFG